MNNIILFYRSLKCYAIIIKKLHNYILLIKIWAQGEVNRNKTILGENTYLYGKKMYEIKECTLYILFYVVLFTTVDYIPYCVVETYLNLSNCN